METSLILTIYNEEKTIGKLIESILKQTKVPNEIIIVDSLSTDDTIKIINSFKSKKIKLIEKKIDIGNGRNLAIENAKHSIILITDGGCVLDEKWCEEISKPLEDSEVNIVGGVFKPLAKNFFEKCQGVIVCKPIEEINENKFLPSSRSLALRKKVWKEIGGYPTHRIGGEDTKFVLDLKKRGYKIKINKKAIAYWRMRSPLKNFIKQYYLYAVGDAKMGNFRRMRTNFFFVLITMGYILTLTLSLLASIRLTLILLSIPLLYFFLQGLKVAFKVRSIKGLYWGFVLSFFKRTAYVFGILREYILPYKGIYKNENYRGGK